jgi:DNA topoisomerase-1
VWLRKGPYGLYVQLGEAQESKGKGKTKEKPKRTSLPKGMDAATLDLARALALLALPRQIGAHPESGAEIIAGLGRYGPYIRHDGKYISLKDDDVLTIGLNRAVTLIAEAPAGAKATALGDHPGDGKPVTVRAGRFGPYVQHGALRATLPKSMEPETVTLDAALALLAAKAAKGGKGAKKKPRKAAKRKKAAKGAAGAGAGNE